jgi:Domain of unknown function (DUF4780)
MKSIQIKESLMDKIDQIDPSDQETVRPGFLGKKYWSGYLQIQCKDLFTLNWLKSQIKTIKIGGSNLVVKSKEDLPKSLLASFFIPGKSVDKKAVLKRIATLNSDLRASSLQIIGALLRCGRG